MSAVYLTEQLDEGVDTKLVPVVTYPETTSQQLENTSLLLPAERMGIEQVFPVGAIVPLVASQTPEPDPIVVPLIHAEVVMGLLVTGRKDRPWDDREQLQIDQVADTLALACVLDQRSQWLAQNQQQQQAFYHQQHDLLHNLLHQFRNPLTALRTFGKLLLKRLVVEDTNRDVATGIVRESDRLQELLKQFEQVVDLDVLAKPPLALDSSSASANQPLLLPAANTLGERLTLKPYPLSDVLKPFFTSLAAIAQERGVALTLPQLNGLPSVLIDAVAFQEVFSNLVDNAFKYTDAGGEVLLHVLPRVQPDFEARLPRRSLPDWLGIAVSDTGPGIPLEDQAHLFERHFRGVQAAGQIPGTGLGLAIARDLLQQMGGKIQVFSPARMQPNYDSPRFGPGTTFIIWLPVAGRH